MLGKRLNIQGGFPTARIFYKLLITLLVFKCNSQDIKGTDKTNVLFIGNSLTYYHDMPATVQKMMNETNLYFNSEQSTFPGMSLDGHMNNIIESQRIIYI